MRSAGTCRIIAAPSSIWHGGAVFGSLAAVVLLPDRNVGIYIAVNSEEGEIVRGLIYELLDHYLGLPQGRWPEKLHEFKMARLERGGEGACRSAGRAAGEGRPVAAARPLRRRLYRPLVRHDQGPPGGPGA